ncbi:6-aminohexanoate hydrolase, partial [Rhizobium ruizarguesonis]
KRARRYPILRRMIRRLSLLLLLCLPLAATEPVAAQSTASAVAGLGPRLDHAASDPAIGSLKTGIVARDGRVLSERG